RGDVPVDEPERAAFPGERVAEHADDLRRRFLERLRLGEDTRDSMLGREPPLALLSGRDVEQEALCAQWRALVVDHHQTLVLDPHRTPVTGDQAVLVV